jgi:hypothetical protein
MLAWKYRILLAAGTLGLAAWAGYSAERRVMDSAGNQPLTFQSVVRRVMAPRSRTERIGRLNELRHLAGRSQPTPRESAECWEIIRGFSVDDVKAALAEIPQTPAREVNGMLIGMLFFRWGQMDPETAAREATQAPYAENYTAILSVATAWADRDPEAALHWAATVESRLAKNSIGNAAGKMLALRRPEDALKVFAEFPGARNGVIATLAREASGTEEARRKLISQLAALPDQTALRQYLQQLSWTLAYNDPKAAQALIGEVERSGISQEDIATVRSLVLSYVRRSAAEKTADWMQQLDAKATPHEQQSHFSQWAVSEPERAAAWASQEGRADLVAEVVKKGSLGLLRSNWQPGVDESSNSPWVKGILSQYETWRKLDASGAAAWLQTMPTDIRNHLSQDHATR